MPNLSSSENIAVPVDDAWTLKTQFLAVECQKSLLCQYFQKCVIEVQENGKNYESLYGCPWKKMANSTSNTLKVYKLIFLAIFWEKRHNLPL